MYACVYLCGYIHIHIQDMFVCVQMIPGKIPMKLGTTVVSGRGIRTEKRG